MLRVAQVEVDCRPASKAPVVPTPRNNDTQMAVFTRRFSTVSDRFSGSWCRFPEPWGQDGENGEKTGKKRAKMGEKWSKKSGGRWQSLLCGVGTSPRQRWRSRLGAPASCRTPGARHSSPVRNQGWMLEERNQNHLRDCAATHVAEPAATPEIPKRVGLRPDEKRRQGRVESSLRLVVRVHLHKMRRESAQLCACPDSSVQLRTVSSV